MRLLKFFIDVEKQVASVYTKAIFLKFQDELHRSLSTAMLLQTPMPIPFLCGHERVSRDSVKLSAVTNKVDENMLWTEESNQYTLGFDGPPPKDHSSQSQDQILIEEQRGAKLLKLMWHKFLKHVMNILTTAVVVMFITTCVMLSLSKEYGIEVLGGGYCAQLHTRDAPFYPLGRVRNVGGHSICVV